MIELPQQLVFNRMEVKKLLAEQRYGIFQEFHGVVKEVRSAYPETVFPPESKSNDCKNAKMARKTCDDILRLLAEKNNKEPKQEIEVKPVTKYENPENPADPYIWSKYRGWRGVILKEAKNGTDEAYLTRISKDGVQYIRAILNKTDVEIL